jgi:tRNA threonylcarbamoyladenosine biosynthesis protein TsaB
MFLNMALILNIETSTRVCSVNIAKDGVKIIGMETDEPNAHSKVLTVYIQDLLKQSGIVIKELDALAVSKGPGSYTGLRIGVSCAKGIAYGAGKKLLSVNTLLNMAWGAIGMIKGKEESVLSPVIDARRMEVYTQMFDYELHPLSDIQALIIDENSFIGFRENRSIYIFGDGAEKCKPILNQPNIVFLENITPSADHMIPFSEEAYHFGNFEDVAYFEPFYLKDFVASIPTKNIFSKPFNE